MATKTTVKTTKKVEKKEKQVTTTIYMDRLVFQEAHAKKEEENRRSFSEFVEHAVKFYLKNNK